jgi:hypothetical protein
MRMPLHVIVPRFDVDIRGGSQSVAKLVTSRHRARKSSTDPNMRLPCWFSAEHRVKRDEFEHVNGLQFQLCGDPRDGFLGNEAEVLLPQMKQGQRGTPFRNGIMGNRLVDFG